MKSILIAGALFMLTPEIASAGAINQVDYASLTETQLITFDEVTGGSNPGTNYNGLLTIGSVAFGERFAGQALSSLGDSDVLSGTPTDTLTLLSGAASQNLIVLNGALAGLGPAQYPNQEASGEGAISILFATGQSRFGFETLGGQSGTAHISFYRGDGSLIQAIALTPLETFSYGFARENGVEDIRGISIWNDDFGGIGYDNLRYGVAVPEPAGWALMILGFGLAGSVLRGRTAAAAVDGLP